jgi:hypothetical protein
VEFAKKCFTTAAWIVEARQTRHKTLSGIEVFSGEAALECGGSRRRFPSVPHTRNGQERMQTLTSLFRDGDADERLL